MTIRKVEKMTEKNVTGNYHNTVTADNCAKSTKETDGG